MGALQDLGYNVNNSNAEPFVVVGRRRLLRGGGEVDELPFHKISYGKDIKPRKFKEFIPVERMQTKQQEPKKEEED